MLDRQERCIVSYPTQSPPQTDHCATAVTQEVGGMSRQRRCLANRALASAAQGYVGALQQITTPRVNSLHPVTCAVLLCTPEAVQLHMQPVAIHTRTA